MILHVFECVLILGFFSISSRASESVFRRFLENAPPNVGNICPQVTHCPCFRTFVPPCMICPCLQNQGIQDMKSQTSKPTSSSGPCLMYNPKCPLLNHRDSKGCVVCNEPKTTTTMRATTTKPTTSQRTTPKTITEKTTPTTTEFITITPPTTPTPLPSQISINPPTSTLPSIKPDITPSSTSTLPRTTAPQPLDFTTRKPTIYQTTINGLLSTTKVIETTTSPMATTPTTTIPRTTPTTTTTVSSTSTTQRTTTSAPSTTKSTTTILTTTLDEYGCPAFNEKCPDTPECLIYAGDCPVCKCEISTGPPTCPSVTCLLDCGSFPLKTDMNGCTVCECDLTG